MENQEKSDFSDIFLLKSHRHVIPNLGTHRTELCQVRADFEVFEWSLTVLQHGRWSSGYSIRAIRCGYPGGTLSLSQKSTYIYSTLHETQTATYGKNKKVKSVRARPGRAHSFALGPLTPGASPHLTHTRFMVRFQLSHTSHGVCVSIVVSDMS